MSKEIFKTDKNQKTVEIEIILKVKLDKIFQPAIAGNAFKDLINSKRIIAYDLIDKPKNREEFINSKLISATKHMNYSIIFSLIFFALHKLPKIEKISMEKVKKDKILNFFTEISFSVLRDCIFNIIIDVKGYELPRMLFWQASISADMISNLLFSKITKHINNPIINTGMTLR